MVASLPAVSLAGSEMVQALSSDRAFQAHMLPPVHMRVGYQGLQTCPFVSRDLERCSIQTLHHIVECHPSQRDQHTIVLDSRVCCKENWPCSCPSRYLCTGEMGEEPTSWWLGEWTMFCQYFQQRTDNLNVQQISIKLSHWVFSGLNLKWPLTAHALNAFFLAGANMEAVEPCRGGSWLAEVGN